MNLDKAAPAALAFGALICVVVEVVLGVAVIAAPMTLWATLVLLGVVLAVGGVCFTVLVDAASRSNDR